MPTEAIKGNTTAIYGTDSRLTGSEFSGAIVLPPGIEITPVTVKTQVIANAKIKRQVHRDQALRATFTVLYDTTLSPYPKAGDTVTIDTEEYGEINFTVDEDPKIMFRDGDDATIAYVCEAAEGIDYVSS